MYLTYIMVGPGNSKSRKIYGVGTYFFIQLPSTCILPNLLNIMCSPGLKWKRRLPITYIKWFFEKLFEINWNTSQPFTSAWRISSKYMEDILQVKGNHYEYEKKDLLILLSFASDHYLVLLPYAYKDILHLYVFGPTFHFELKSATDQTQLFWSICSLYEVKGPFYV